MTYAYDLESGQRLIVQNDGDNTLVALSNGDEGQQQSQSTGFQTGKWSKTPELFHARGGLVLRLETKNGMEYIRIRGSQIQSMRSEPDLENMERLKLKKSDENVAMKPMEPMRPMEPMKPMEPMQPMQPMQPMKPMEPMKPMKPMGGLRPMEMRMGGMHMSMGAGETEAPPAKQFCTQCGKPVQKKDRFCASCGHNLLE